MSSRGHRIKPGVDALEARLVLSATATAAALSLPAQIVGDLNSDGTVNTDDLRTFAAAYLSRRGDPRYNPAADTNGNGQIGHDDVRPILHALAPVTPREPLRVSLALGLGDQVVGHHPANSGGVTRRSVVTIVGRTTPNSIVFTDGPKGDYRFAGLALPVDSNGFFSYRLRLKDALTQTEYLTLDPFGNQTIRAFPIRRL